VYVTVYADGPTRVLSFSDDKNVSSLEQQHAVLDLAARLKQVTTQLREINTHFSRLNGVSGVHVLDLYGRPPQEDAFPTALMPTLSKKSSRRAPMSAAAKVRSCFLLVCTAAKAGASLVQ
jgi:hypothetical protein